MYKIYVQPAPEFDGILAISTEPTTEISLEVCLEEPTLDISKIPGYTIEQSIDSYTLKFNQDRYDLYLKEKEKEEAIEAGKKKLEELQYQPVLLTASDEDAYVMRYMYGEWDPKGHEYKKGDRFLYNDNFYKVLQNHISQADWTPNAASSLYVEISDPSIEWPEFKQPTGAHDAYMKDDKVAYNGKHYISLIDNNTWSPDDYPQGWKLVE